MLAPFAPTFTVTGALGLLASASAPVPAKPPRLNVPTPVPNASPLSLLIVTVLFCKALAWPARSVPLEIIAPPLKGLAAERTSVPGPVSDSDLAPPVSAMPPPIVNWLLSATETAKLPARARGALIAFVPPFTAIEALDPPLSIESVPGPLTVALTLPLNVMPPTVSPELSSAIDGFDDALPKIAVRLAPLGVVPPCQLLPVAQLLLVPPTQTNEEIGVKIATAKGFLEFVFVTAEPTYVSVPAASAETPPPAARMLIPEVPSQSSARFRWRFHRRWLNR